MAEKGSGSASLGEKGVTGTSIDSGLEGIGFAQFKPYQSILNFPSVSSNSSSTGTGPTESNKTSLRISNDPPWRRAVGHAFFDLDSELDVIVETQLEDAADSNRYMDLLERTFEAFACPSVGALQDVIDCAVGPMQAVEGWSVDSEPRRGHVEGDKEIAYDTVNAAGSLSLSGSKLSSRAS